jgi:hypothetical protein
VCLLSCLPSLLLHGGTTILHGEMVVILCSIVREVSLVSRITLAHGNFGSSHLG